MGSATGWVRRHPGVLVLLAAIIAGQVLKAVVQPHLLDSPLVGQVPLIPVLSLAAAIVLALLILYLRMRLGQQLVTAARQRALSLPDPASLPKRYAVQDAPGQITSGGLGVLDLALLLLVQSTLLPPIIVLADRFLVPRTWTTIAFVGVVVLIALLLLAKLWRVGGPVLVLLLWWALDRVVPTAGFLGARAEVAAAPTTVARPAVIAEPTLAAGVQDATVAAKRPNQDLDGPTIVSVRRAQTPEATVVSDATIVSRPKDDEATVVSRPKDDEATILKQPDSA